MIFSAQSQPDHLSRIKVKEAIIPIYHGTQSTPVMIFRAGKIFTDHQRKGFFRIGLLPILVAEGVMLEVLRPEEIIQSWPRIEDQFRIFNGTRFGELRNVKFIFPSPTTNYLSAGRIRMEEKGRWQLLDGVTLQTASGKLEAAEATLELTGEFAGQLTCKTGKASTQMNLFSIVQSIPSKKDQPNEN